MQRKLILLKIRNITILRCFVTFISTYHVTIFSLRHKPSWLSWLERQSHNLKVVSSSLTEGIDFFHFRVFSQNVLLKMHFWCDSPFDSSSKCISSTTLIIKLRMYSLQTITQLLKVRALCILLQ